MSVHQLKDGRWIVCYRVGKIYKREYFGKGLEAEQRAVARNEDLCLNEYHKTNNPVRPIMPVFAELANAYLAARMIHMQPSTLYTLKYKLYSVILPAIGGLMASHVTPDRIDNFVSARTKEGKTKSTIHRDLSDIMAILNWGVKRGILIKSPLAGYEKPKRNDAVIVPPTPEEVRKIIGKSAPHLIRALSICYYTGLRPGASELLGIKWTAVDWTRKTILIYSAQKNGPRSRLLPLHDAFFAQLEAWHITDGHDDEIIQYRGQPVQSLKKAYNAAKKRAGITRRLPMYSFRHAFASTVLSNSANLKATSEILGHSRPDTTLRIYQHTHPEMYRSVIDLLPDLLPKQPQKTPDKSNDLPGAESIK